MSLAERLKLARIQLGWTRKEAGDHARVDVNLIYLYETGRRNPSTLALHGLAALYGKSVDWFYEEAGDEEEHPEERLLPEPAFEAEAALQDEEKAGSRLDENETSVSHVLPDRLELLAHMLADAAREHEVSLDYLVGLTDDPTPSTVWAARLTEAEARASTPIISESGSAYEAGSTGRRPVEVLEVASAAGGGAEVYDETPIGLLWFRSDWLNRHGIDPKQSNIISAHGESMEPTLPDGCSILVDKNRRTLRGGRIYVMRTDDGLVVKRVGEDEDGRWQMLSDNPAWSPIPLVEETEIIGEVRWLGRTL